jgi:TolB-like protein/Tfp pilus assembly protein PilF/predicted Ser/Thr protein kinase
MTFKTAQPVMIKGGTFSRKYKIIGEVGRGGMGIVLKAEDIKLKRIVALKFLPPELTSDPQARERFVQEAQAAAALDHPNICTIFEINEAKGQTFIAMAYIEGRSLREEIVQGPLEIEQAVNIATQVAEGLRAAHEKGIIHRDIKPANIMLTGTGLAKIMDFGLAKLEWGADMTRTPVLMGTLAYMSPEQARGEKVDVRADIWALGCVLFEMLSGRRPFKGPSDQTVLHSILHDPPPPIAGLRPNVPAGLERILQRCLQKDPRNRFQDAAGLILSLKAIDFGQVSASLSASPPKYQAPSIAVLPFVDMSPEKDQAYFCEGIADELINALARLKELRVVARTSAFALKGMNLDVREIGRMLDVKAVLEGSLRKAGNRLRITAQLINAEDGYHIWSEKFDREMNDIFAIQDEISLAIVDSLKVKLLAGDKTALRKRHTDDPEAYNLYLKGLHFFSKMSAEGFQKAMEFFRAAADKDPGFALAYTGMANIFVSLSTLNFAPPREMWPKAKAALQKALELDPHLAEAHALVAMCAFWYDLDWDSAEASFQRTLALNPGNAMTHFQYAGFCLNRKRFDEMLREIKIAQKLDPLMPLFNFFSVHLHVMARQPDAAIEEFRKAVELDPKSGMAYFHVGLAYSQKRLFDEAIAAWQKAEELGVYAGWTDVNLAMAYFARGEREKSRQIFERIIAPDKKSLVSSLNLGWLWASWGDLGRAFECFNKAYEARDPLIPFFHVYTDLNAEIFGLDPIRKDPRYRDLLKKLNLDF